MKYPSLRDLFERADTDNISGLSDSGHLWIPSGKCLPCIRNGNLTGSHPAVYDGGITYSQWNNVLYQGAVYVYKNAAPSSGNLPTDTDYWEGESGNYAYIDVFKSPGHQYVDCSWASLTEPIVLASSNRLSSNGTTQDLTHTTHIYFSGTAVNAQVRENSGTFDSVLSIDYAASVTLGQVYRIGVKFDGPRLTLQLPDGSEKAIVSTRFSNVYGRYLMYQSMYGSTIHAAYCDLQGRRLVV